MEAVVLTTSLLILIVGTLALAANKNRVTNQCFFLFSICLGVSVGCIYGAIKAGEIFVRDGIGNPIPWLQGNAFFGNFLPALLVVSRDSIRFPQRDRRTLFKHSAPWLTLGIILSVIVFTDSFIPPESSHYNRTRGPGYYLVTLSLAIAYAFFIIQTSIQARKAKGVARIELQLVILNISTAHALFIILSFFGNTKHIYTFKIIALIGMLASVVLATFSICYYRIFDFRDVLRSTLHWLTMIIFISCSGMLIAKPLIQMMPETWAWLLVLAALSLSAPWLDRRVRGLFGLGEGRRVAQLRRAALEMARDELEKDTLIFRYQSLLQRECGAALAILASKNHEAFIGNRFTFSKQRSGFVALCSLGWASVETLRRRRSTPALEDLRAVLTENALSVIVAVPRDSSSPSLLVGLGPKANEKPYTYAEVERLQAIAELMDNILTHSRLTSQAALQAKIEHLAMMSRGLAHDLKNLITPVSSFLIHTDGRFPPESPEAEVHAAARRSMRVMTDYVRDALFFSERLQPKLENVDLPKLLDAVRELTVDRAGARGVTVFSSVDLAEPVVADGVLLQRMLVNLVSNAIDASARGQTVALSASQTPNDWLQIVVRDEGCGISTENLTRIFEPYFTTKQFGEDVRGFGLGLTICQKITNLHGGLISVESKLGKGTHVTVNLPTSAVSRRLLPGPPCLALP